MARIIDQNYMLKLEKLLEGSEDDANLAVKIIDKCDIEKSFPYLLCLMSTRVDTSDHYKKPYIHKSQNLKTFEKKIISNSYYKSLNNYRLNKIIDLLELYEAFISKVDTKIRKLIIQHYVAHDVNDPSAPDMLNYNVKLNPKKNVKRKK